MGKKFGRLLITFFGVILGTSMFWLLNKNQELLGIAPYLSAAPSWVVTTLFAVSAIIGGVVFFFLAPPIIKLIIRSIKRIEKKSSELTMQQIFVGVIGLVVGLVIALLISLLIQRIPINSIVILLDIIMFVSLGYLGFKIPISRIKEFNLPNWFKRGEKSDRADVTAKPKILDTSSIIDGRFFDVYKTGVIEGKIIIPEFVLDELRHIADSSDPHKRSRGRRGLDLIGDMQSDNSRQIIVSQTDYPDLEEVDTKLLRLAIELGGKVVTNDYNLCKVAAVQSVPVFNINDLSNALRINVVAGQVVELTIVKEGKEHGQGVAYFEDGTMVVIDGGAKLVGETVEATVTSVLQTSAGRMVFAKVEQ